MFDGSLADGKALAYGHSYTGNALGCAAAKASLEVFEKESVLDALQRKIGYLKSALSGLGDFPDVVEVRQCGFVAGIEMEQPQQGGLPNLAAEICVDARRRGLLTRPIRNVIVLMPPLCITSAQLKQAVDSLRASITEICRRRSVENQQRNVEKITA
jgi:adenosylmethionine-8-amino-7-oxononanoate aminotransferase